MMSPTFLAKNDPVLGSCKPEFLGGLQAIKSWWLYKFATETPLLIPNSYAVLALPTA